MPAAQAAKETITAPVFSLAAPAACPDKPTLATWLRFAKNELTANSHRGHQLPTAVLYQGIGPAISNTANGLELPLYDSGRRSRSTGKERDAESGLDFFEARYLSGAQGRFMSADPSGLYFADPTNPQSFNLYSYVGNNPLSYTGPDGLWNWSIGNCYFNTVATYVNGEFQGYDTQSLGCFQTSPTPQTLTQAPTPRGAGVDANEAATAAQNRFIRSAWWINKVKPFGDWDYADSNGQQFRAFGNLNFGATCNALGLSLTDCQRGPGAAAVATGAGNQARGGRDTSGPGTPLDLLVTTMECQFTATRQTPRKINP